MERLLKTLKRDQTDTLVEPWRTVAHSPVPPRGWIRAIREALGMTRAQLAARLRVAPQTIEDLEQSEAAGKITLVSLNRLAHALGCRVAYAVVPEKPLAEMQRDRAREVADAMLQPVSHSMGLEAQRVSERELERQRDRLVETLLQGSPRKLWNP